MALPRPGAVCRFTIAGRRLIWAKPSAMPTGIISCRPRKYRKSSGNSWSSVSSEEPGFPNQVVRPWVRRSSSVACRTVVMGALPDRPCVADRSVYAACSLGAWSRSAPRSEGAFDARLRGVRRAGEHEAPDPEGEAEQPEDLCQRKGPHIGPGEQRDPESHREQPTEAEQGTFAGGLPRRKCHGEFPDADDDGPRADPDRQRQGGDVRPGEGDDTGGDVEESEQQMAGDWARLFAGEGPHALADG